MITKPLFFARKSLFLLLATLAVAGLYVVVNSKVTAQCTPIYGGGEQCPATNIAVNKTVQNPQTNAFVDNLGVNDPKFSAEQIVNFQIVVTNTGGALIPRVVVKDVIPQFVNFVSGPGSFDSATKTLTFEVTSLNVGESRTFSIVAKTVAENELPQDVGIACPTNIVTVTTNENKSAQDTAQFCIERKVLGAQPPTQAVKVFPPSKVTIVPVTGPEVLYVFAFVPTALLGFAIQRRAFSV